MQPSYALVSWKLPGARRASGLGKVTKGAGISEGRALARLEDGDTEKLEEVTHEAVGGAAREVGRANGQRAYYTELHFRKGKIAAGAV